MPRPIQVTRLDRSCPSSALHAFITFRLSTFMRCQLTCSTGCGGRRHCPAATHTLKGRQQGRRTGERE